MSNRAFIALLIFLIVSDGIVFIFFGLDKRRAVNNQWRISESTLLKAALIGSLGALAGMRVFRHKTRKPVFRFLVPFFLILRITILAVWRIMA